MKKLLFINSNLILCFLCFIIVSCKKEYVSIEENSPILNTIELYFGHTTYRPDNKTVLAIVTRNSATGQIVLISNELKKLQVLNSLGVKINIFVLAKDFEITEKNEIKKEIGFRRVSIMTGWNEQEQPDGSTCFVYGTLYYEPNGNYYTFEPNPTVNPICGNFA